MTICILLSLLVIRTEFQQWYVKLNEIQTIELTEFPKDGGGIIAFYLKDKKEEIIVKLNDDEFKEASDWLWENALSLGSEMKRTDIDESRAYESKF
jgi:hypothetical protein